jgi:rhodanese-related sulfurtransferase
VPIDIGRDEVRRLVGGGALVLEVLPPDEFELQHIAGAVNVPLDELGGARLDGFERGRPVVVYCNDAL